MDSLDRAHALLREHPVIDGHNDLPWVARDHGYSWAAYDIAGTTAGHTDIPRLRAGGVGGQFWSVYVPGTLPRHEGVTQTLEQIDAVYAMVERYPDTFALVTSADGIESAMAAGRIASLLGAEGGQSIAASLGALRMLHRVGVRYLTLTHNENVEWADSATDTPVHGGLTEYGVRVVREMNRLGMFVDLSHVHADTMRAALAVSEAPVIFSHSSARAVTNVPRNVPDDVLSLLADNGGVCMAVFAPRFVTRDPSRAADLDDVVAHVEHLASVAGHEHVGIGGDYDGVSTTPVGLEDVSTYPRLVAALLDRGWTDGQLAGLTCRNILRAMRQMESVAAALQTQREADLTAYEPV